METWDLIKEAVIRRATKLAMDDVYAQFNRGEFPEFHLDECLKQAMAELVTLFKEADKTVEEHMKSEKHSPHGSEEKGRGHDTTIH